MSSKLLKSFLILLLGLWITFVLSDYFRIDTNYFKAIAYFEYADLLVVMIAISAGISYYIKRRSSESTFLIRPIYVILFLFILDFITVFLFSWRMDDIPFSLTNYIYHAGSIFLVSSMILSIYLLLRVLGSKQLDLLPMNITDTDKPIVEVALGALIFTGLLFVLGSFSILYNFVVGPLLLGILVLFWRSTLSVSKQLFFTKLKVPKNINAIGIFSYLFIILFIVINFIHIVRPVPIGADSLNYYVNLSSLISQYHGLVAGHQPYNWSLLMSSGFILFGMIDVALGLSFLGGLLSLVALYRLSQKWININYSLLVVLIFYSLPMVNFLSYLDMKVDMALCFISLTSLLLFYTFLNASVDTAESTNQFTSIRNDNKKSSFLGMTKAFIIDNSILLYLGVLLGFAFGIKLTALFLFIAIQCSLWYNKGGIISFLAAFFLSFGAVFLMRLDARTELRVFHYGVDTLQWVLITIGIMILSYQYVKNREKIKSLLRYSMILIFAFAIPVLPWVGKNFVETQKLDVSSLISGQLAKPTIDYDKTIGDGGSRDKEKNQKKTSIQSDALIDSVYSVDNDTQGDSTTGSLNDTIDNIEEQSSEAKEPVSTTAAEDLHRFFGFEVLPIRYLSIPYDTLQKSNFAAFFTDISFLLLLFLPLIFIFHNETLATKQRLISNLVFLSAIFFYLFICVGSSLYNKFNGLQKNEILENLLANQSSNAFEMYQNMLMRLSLYVYSPIHLALLAIQDVIPLVTYPFMFLVFIFIVYLVNSRISNHTRRTQSMIYVVMMYIFLWWILGSGVPWYGFIGFVIPFIFIFYAISEDRQLGTIINTYTFKFKKYVILVFSLIWILLAFCMKTSNFRPADKEVSKHLFYPAIIKHQMGMINKKEFMDIHFPNILLFSDLINKDRNSKVLRIGSPINFFIEKNDSRVLNDTFLDAITALYLKYDKKQKVVRHLKSEGFKYIVFDLNMASYDSTPDKTLTKKYKDFMDVLYENNLLELLATDRIVQGASQNEMVFAVFPEERKVVYSGTIAIYKIK